MIEQWDAGRLLQDAREQRGMSKVEAANAAALSESWWRKTEAGYFRTHGKDHTYRPTPETLSRAAQVVGLPPARLLHAGDYPGYTNTEELEPRDDLHRLIDQLPEPSIPIARAYLHGLLGQAQQPPE